MRKTIVAERLVAEWALLIVYVPKKNGNFRFCVYYRQLDAVTVQDIYPIQRMDGCIDLCREEKIVSKLDGNSGNWQI